MKDEINKPYSVVAALEFLDSKIEELEKITKSDKELTDKLLINQRQKEALLQALKTTRTNIQVNNSTYDDKRGSVKGLDSEMEKIEKDIEAKKNRIQELKNPKKISDLLFWNFRVKHNMRKIKSLTSKKGNLEAEQRKVTSKILSSEIRKISKYTNKIGKINAYNDVKERINNDSIANSKKIEENNDKILSTMVQNGEFQSQNIHDAIRIGKENAKLAINNLGGRLKNVSLNSKIRSLQNKTGDLNSLSKLSPELAQHIRKTFNNKVQSVNTTGIHR